MITKCGQSFCRKCIEKWLNGHKKCPNCIRHLSTRDLIPNKTVSYIIEQLEVRCCYHLDSCTETVEFGVLSSHVKTCQYQLCKCGFRGIGDGHNCMEYLMADNKNLRNENDKLVKKVNAYLEEFGPLPTDFTGKYKLMSTDNYNGFLEYLEITDSEPNLINRLMPIIEIRSEDNVFTILAGNVIQD